MLASLAACARAPHPAPPRAESCLAALRAAGLGVEPWDAPTAGACRVEAPVRLARTRLALSRPLETSCALASAWLRYEEELGRLARRVTGRELVAIEHAGSHACRPMTGNAGRASLHARALALDVVAFRLSDGSRIAVEEHWRDRGPAGRFLRAAAELACRHFAMVLTPDSDRWHRDHFHFDLGPFSRCDA
ncbi:MAG: extensin family protein [Geminicoccaceae bacterium]|nr:extensin family protein [Geminicoccaceae bacterium]MCS7268994.1 extensin family protein [Geminicoccaceae bacterium]MCX7628999.1 extensin family protein [Geminicoccaceae bacterium]MDW8125283.1 extensin family protein [Geminicoccaceae bacterium]MDW8340465.1 extensin family protein [Geminicoccaceae bacterium]